MTPDDAQQEMLERVADTLWTGAVFAGNPPSLMDKNGEDWAYWKKLAEGAMAMGAMCGQQPVKAEIVDLGPNDDEKVIHVFVRLDGKLAHYSTDEAVRAFAYVSDDGVPTALSLYLPAKLPKPGESWCRSCSKIFQTKLRLDNPRYCSLPCEQEGRNRGDPPPGC